MGAKPEKEKDVCSQNSMQQLRNTIGRISIRTQVKLSSSPIDIPVRMVTHLGTTKLPALSAVPRLEFTKIVAWVSLESTSIR